MNYFFLCNAFIGACLASHAAVIIQHTTENRAFLFTRSRCDSCGYELSLLDEIPILSFLLLKGRCRYCHAKIPSFLLSVEVIGAFTFLKINFANLGGILKTIFLFYFLLATLEDWQAKEFSTILFLPPTLIAIFWHWTSCDSTWPLTEKFAFGTISLLLILFVFKKKMGTGDLWAYLILAFAYSPNFANQIFFLASFLMLLNFFFLKARDKQAFLPYLFFSLIYLNLWQ